MKAEPLDPRTQSLARLLCCSALTYLPFILSAIVHASSGTVQPHTLLTSRSAGSSAENSEDAETFVPQRQGRKLLGAFDWLGALW